MTPRSKQRKARKRRTGSAGSEEIHSLEEILDRVEELAEGSGRVSLGDLLDAIGHRSFGPLLVLAGCVMVAPIVGDVPGVPTLMGLFVILTAVQILFHREHLWLPAWLLDRSLAPAKIRRVVGWLRRPARWLDRVSRRRLTLLIRGPGRIAVAVASVGLAAATPLMEVVPMSANVAGAAIAAFGLAWIASDGLVALLALVFAGGTLGLVLAGVA